MRLLKLRFYNFLLIYLIVIQFTSAEDLKKSKIESAITISKSLILDLDANYGVVTDENSMVSKWYNRVENPQVKYFEDQNEIRRKLLKEPHGPGTSDPWGNWTAPVSEDGRPRLIRNVPEINKNNSIFFDRDELHHSLEEKANWKKAFGDLHNKSGYTWFVVIKPGVHEFIPKGKKGVPRAIFGNLRNTAQPEKESHQYAGIWAGINEKNLIWGGTRAGYNFWNPQVQIPVEINKWVIIAVRQGSFENLPLNGKSQKDKAPLQIWAGGEFKKTVPFRNFKPYIQRGEPVMASRMVIGQERDAINHMGVESFAGELSRLLIYKRPLSDIEMKEVSRQLNLIYIK